MSKNIRDSMSAKLQSTMVQFNSDISESLVEITSSTQAPSGGPEEPCG